jgi:hypothetical protein
VGLGRVKTPGRALRMECDSSNAVYPTKVARERCLVIWKRRRLEERTADVVAGVRRWSSP